MKNRLRNITPNLCWRAFKYIYYQSGYPDHLARRESKNYHNSGEAQRIKAQLKRHPNKRCFILGNGPSIKHLNLELLKDEFTFIVNWFPLHEQCLQLKPNFYCVNDASFFGNWSQIKVNLNWHNLITSQIPDTELFFPFRFKTHIAANNYFTKQNIYYLDFSLNHSHRLTLSKTRDLEWDITNPLVSSGTVLIDFCIPIATYMGFTEIYLLGCDCNYEMNGEPYFYDTSLHTTERYDHLNQNDLWGIHGKIQDHYRFLAQSLSQRGVSLYNATDGGKLQPLPRVNLLNLLQ